MLKRLQCTLAFARDPYGALVREFRARGPVFSFPLATQSPVMWVGAEANRSLRALEKTHFVAEPSFAPLGRALGTRRFLLGMDGEAHRELRQCFAPAWSFERMGEYVPAFAEHARTAFAAWNGGAVRQCKRLVFAQLGGSLSPLPATEYYDDVVRVFDTAVKIGVARIWPQLMARRPRNLVSISRLRVLMRELYGRANPDPDSARFIDRVALAVERGLLDREDLLASMMTPYFAGIDTVASTLASGLYELSVRPQLQQRIRDEGTALELRALRKARVLRAFVSEVLRLHPIGVLTMRRTTRPVEGTSIDAGVDVGFCPPMTHFLEEHFERAYEFDVERWLSGPKPAPGTFVPWGIGAHVCLGAGIAEAQLLVTFALAVQEFELRPTRAALEKRLDPLPTPHELELSVTRR